MARGARFLGAGLRTGPADALPATIAAAGRAKAVGNGLRELDRFLSVLIDEVAAVVRPAGLDHAAFARQRNTPNKLRTIRLAMALPCLDHDRLRAIARARDGLFHCAEIVRRGDAALCPDALARRRAHAERLMPDADELAGLCEVYDRIATELVAACATYLERADCADSTRPGFSDVSLTDPFPFDSSEIETRATG